jgi:hypothetical protein
MTSPTPQPSPRQPRAAGQQPAHERRGWQTASVSTTTPTAIRPALDELPAQLRDGLDARLGGTAAAEGRLSKGRHAPKIALPGTCGVHRRYMRGTSGC